MHTIAEPKHQRYIGFDFLRGICALLVCIYHLLLWQGIANLHLVGYYNVYIFFVLSGASMTISYAKKIANGMNMKTFIGRRFFRLAPLYWLITLIFGYTSTTWAPLILNLTFLFGFANPAFTSRVVGGWSLGIEFVFYFLFPLYLQCITSKRWPYIILIASITIQQLFINSWIQQDNDLTTHVYEYTQFAAFFAYFLGGCVIGKILLYSQALIARPSLIWLLFTTLFVSMETVASHSSDLRLTSVFGFIFTLACMICTALASFLQFKPWLQFLPRFSGKISYGLYLLHPVLYFSLIKHTQFQQIMGIPTFTAFIILSSMIIAAFLERYFEQPIKKWGYKLL